MPTSRDLPSVDQVLRSIGSIDGIPQPVLANEVRSVLNNRRRTIQEGAVLSEVPVAEEVRRRLSALVTPTLRHVINATGVVLHTNLGRAPLCDFAPHKGYTNLEYDLNTGKRGKRDAHISPLLERLLGKSAIVVNNNAAAVYLVLNELSEGGEVIVSRGELIEIGDGFRIPEIMARSGAVLREVGTTNRTRIEDYKQAITPNTRLLLRVHRSNFHISGFTDRPSLSDLSSLAQTHGIPLYEDLGSGCLTDLASCGIEEPLVKDSFEAGVNVVSFSGDKLLGGPQVGIIAGDSEWIARIRRNPMYRAFRVDKLILQALETTLQHILREDWVQVPALRMIHTPLSELRLRAEGIVQQLISPIFKIRETESVIGGGSTPNQTLPTCVIEASMPNAALVDRQLRRAPTPVIARIEKNKIIIDLRTVFEEEEPALIDALRSACELFAKIPAR